MNNRLVRIGLSLCLGSIAVALGLYFGRFAAAAVALPFASSRQALPFATGITWWAFVGLLAGLGLAFTAIGRRRARWTAMSVLGFGLGGALAAALVAAGSANRGSPLAALSLPLGGALAGLLLGLAAGLKIRSIALLIAGALAMWIAAPHIGSPLPPRSLMDVLISAIAGGSAGDAANSAALAGNTLSLLAPGALIGATLAALAPEAGDDRPAQSSP